MGEPGVVEVLERLGGVARRGALLRWSDRAAIDRAVAGGDVLRDGRGRYALPTADVAVRAAARLGGVVGLTDAALHHGWAVKQVPTVPTVVVSRGRRLPTSPGARVIRAELSPDQVDGHWTDAPTTLEHCLRRLPFDEALCVADSALRDGLGRDTLDRLAARAQGPGSARLRRVAGITTPLAANPFESCLRAVCEDVPGLRVQPQVWLPGLALRPDLVDERLRVVLEADSFAWHGHRAALARDCRRYNIMVCEGWLVLRFSYEDVMGDPQYVRSTLIAAVALAELLKEALELRARAA